MWILCSVAVGRFAFVLIRSFSCIHNYYDVYIAIYICPPTTTSFLSNNDNESNFMLYTFILYTLNCYFQTTTFFLCLLALQSKSSKSSGSSFLQFSKLNLILPLSSLLLNIYTSFLPPVVLIYELKVLHLKRAMWIDIILCFSKKKND